MRQCTSLPRLLSYTVACKESLWDTTTTTKPLLIILQGVPYVRGRYCNLRLSKLARDIKVSFGYDVPIFVDYTYAKNEPSEHLGSGVSLRI
jgi:hypothetical protein